MKKLTKCRRVTYDHKLRYLYPEEVKKRDIKSKGIGMWECTECGKIIHSM
jgi:hypothetical protein